MEQSARRDGCLVITVSAPVKTSLHFPRLLLFTLGTNKPLGPAQRRKIILTGLLRRKSLPELNDGLRILLHPAKMPQKAQESTA